MLRSVCEPGPERLSSAPAGEGLRSGCALDLRVLRTQGDVSASLAQPSLTPARTGAGLGALSVRGRVIGRRQRRNGERAEICEAKTGLSVAILVSLPQGGGSVGAGETAAGHWKTDPAEDETLAQGILAEEAKTHRGCGLSKVTD